MVFASVRCDWGWNPVRGAKRITNVRAFVLSALPIVGEMAGPFAVLVDLFPRSVDSRFTYAVASSCLSRTKPYRPAPMPL